MITTINNNGENVKCSYTFKTRDGVIYYKNDGKQPTDQFLTARGLYMTGETGTDNNGQTTYILGLLDGWKIDGAKPAKPTKPATPKPAKPATTAQPETATAQPAPVVTETPKPATKPAKPANKPTAKPTATTATDGGALDMLADVVAARVLAQLPDHVTNAAPVSQPTTATTVNITVNGTATGTVEGLTHRKFNKILKLAANRKHVYLYGAAGSGKSHTAQQIATALGLPFYCQMQLVNKYDVIGFVDAGGNYQPTPFYNAFKSGGVILFDEYERGDAGAIITLNGALANDVITFPNGEKVNRHKDFIFISAGNTNCLGNTAEYLTACQLDYSSIDRVGFVRMNYDNRLEDALSANDPTAAAFCRDLRRAIDACGVSMVVSYRAIKELAYFANDDVLTKTDLLDMYLLKGRDRDTAAVLYGALTDKQNAWAVALKQIATGEIDE